MTSVENRCLSDALARAAGRCADLETTAAAICDALADQVPYDFACLATTDPATGLISWAMKTSPLEFGDEEFAAAEYGGWDVNLLSEIARRPEPVGVLSIDTGGDLNSCRRFRDFLVPRFGFTDELRVAFRSRGLTWGAVGLYRGPGEQPFTAAEAAVAVSVHVQAAELIQQALFRPRQPAEQSVNGPAVIVVDGEDQVANMTPAAQAAIEELGGWDHQSLPATVLVTCAAARSTPQLASNRAVGRTGKWLMVRATTFAPAAAATGANEPGTRSDVVVTIDVASPSDVSSLALAAYGLSPREQQIAGLVLQGAATKTIASSLHLSPHTVQDHLKSVFTKIGVNSRREMVQRLVLG